MTTRLLIGWLLACTTATPAALSAQSAGNGFLFGRPKRALSFAVGYARANAGSELFSFTTNQLTLNRSDFSGPTLDVELSVALGAATHLVVTGSYAGTKKGSEFRDFVDQDNQPIQQTTQFQRVPLTVSLKQYLTSPGRTIGSFAWIPAKVAPFVSVGGGAMWYRFRQQGDFIDQSTNEVFPATLSSSRWTAAARASAGLDFTLSPRLALTARGSYLWARGRLGSDFAGFDRIDLTGFSSAIGLSARF